MAKPYPITTREFRQLKKITNSNHLSQTLTPSHQTANITKISIFSSKNKANLEQISKPKGHTKLVQIQFPSTDPHISEHRSWIKKMFLLLKRQQTHPQFVCEPSVCGILSKSLDAVALG